jgi:uncharacterized protein with von Willebrand factor type A (vWA) domain
MFDRFHKGEYHAPNADLYLSRVANGWLAGGGCGVEDRREDDDDILRRELVGITEKEAPKALLLIESLVRRLNSVAERKGRRAGRRGRPDFRATIHASLRTGGIPVVPLYKPRRRSARRIVVLCDVSESMYIFSGFALRFITALSAASGRTRAFIFSEGLVEIALSDWDTFKNTVKQSPLWRRGTNVGLAIAGLLAEKNRILAPADLLIIISDARSVDAAGLRSALHEAARRSRAVIWLNPERKLSSLAELLTADCTMLTCATIEDLAVACGRVTSL